MSATAGVRGVSVWKVACEQEETNEQFMKGIKVQIVKSKPINCVNMQKIMG